MTVSIAHCIPSPAFIHSVCLFLTAIFEIGTIILPILQNENTEAQRVQRLRLTAGKQQAQI